MLHRARSSFHRFDGVKEKNPRRRKRKLCGSISSALCHGSGKVFNSIWI